MRTTRDTPGHLTVEEGKLAIVLSQRLKLRKTAQGEVYTLDLRHHSVGHLGRLTMYQPGGATWPHAGETTAEEDTAWEWLTQRGGYAQYVARTLSASANGAPQHVTVAVAAAAYLAHLAIRKGRLHNTFINRTSAFHKHIGPYFGNTPLIALTRKSVRLFLETLTTVKGGEAVAAACRTKGNTQQALLALWRHTYPDDGCPFGGISIDDASGDRARRTQIIAGDVADVMQAKTHDADQIANMLLTAMWYDAHVLRRPCQRPRFMPLTAETMVMQFVTGMRVSETMRTRWKHILESREAVLVPGLKNTNALRVIPLQRSVIPWLKAMRLKALKGGREATPHDHVLQMQPGRDNRELYTAKQMIRRISDVMRLSGHKIDKKATHACRNTYATMGKLSENLVDLVSLKTYLGHDVHGGATERYVDRFHIDLIIGKMPSSHREFIALPTPDELLARLPGFVPPGMKDYGFTMLKEWKAAGRPGGRD